MSAEHSSDYPRPWDWTTTDKVAIAGALLSMVIGCVASVRVDTTLMVVAVLILAPSTILKVRSTRAKARLERAREAERERRERMDREGEPDRDRGPAET